MEYKWKIIYEKMQADLAAVMKEGFPTENKIAQCFQLCNSYLSTINASPEYQSGNVHFRLKIFPIFMAEAEFFNHLAFASLFCPRQECSERRTFIEREKIRFRRFKKQYIEALRRMQAAPAELELILADHIHNYGLIFSGFIAFEKYIHYLENPA